MSEARTVWHPADVRRTTTAASRERSGLMLAICLLIAMAAAEVLFLRFAAGPESVNLISAAEGIAIPE